MMENEEKDPSTDQNTENVNECDEQNGLHEENVRLKDLLLRATAEMENLRKRFAKEKEDAIKFAISKFAKDLLSVADNFDSALESASTFLCENSDKKIKSFYEGISITEKELKSVLAKNGVKYIDVNKSDELNPDLHQVMCEIECDEVEPGKIACIYQQGYKLHDRLLRPSLVGISRKK